MSNETEQPKIQADESQEKEQAETLSKPGDESSKPEGQVADDQLPQEGDPKATEPDAKAEGSQPNPRLPPTPNAPCNKSCTLGGNWIPPGNVDPLSMWLFKGAVRRTHEKHFTCS
jgi:hypothetical protein